MVQEDIQRLLSTLISTGSISNTYNSKFESIIRTNYTSSEESSKFNKNIIGIYYLFLFKSFYEKNKILLVDLDKNITSHVNKFNNNELNPDEARKALDELISKKMSLEVTIKEIESNINLIPFSQFKNTIEIEKMFNELERMFSEDFRDLKILFINFFNDYEKNKEYLENYQSSEMISSEEFQKFLLRLEDDLDKNASMIDSKQFDETFNNKILSLFENYFLNFKDKKINPIKFNVQLGRTLGDKNNESYFFQGDELENLEPDIDQRYVPQLEINSKINNLISKSSLPNITQLWEMVGSVVMNPVREGIGIAGYPYFDKEDNKAYIAVDIEQEVDLSESDNLYHQLKSMRISEISDKTDSRRQIISNEISETLDVPIELSLFPTIVEEYLGKNKGVSIDFKLQKKKFRTEFYDVSNIVFDKMNEIITIPDELEPVQYNQSFVLVNSPKNNFAQNKNVSLANEKVVGKIISEFSLLDSWYMAIELERPNNNLLDQLSVKLRKSEERSENDMWKLRFTISKVLDIFESEAMKLENLWKYIWHEKIAIFPFDLLTSFIGFAPSGSIDKEFINNESIQLSRGVEIKDLDCFFKNEPFSILSTQKITIGKLIHFYLDPKDKQISLIYCNISEIEILKRLNRDYSSNSLAKLGKRISKALSLKTEKLEIELHPKYLLTYILFYSIQFNVQIDFTNLFAVVEWLISEFELKRVAIEKIKSIDFENLFIEIEA